VVTLGANYSNENWMALPDSAVMAPDDPLILRISELMKKTSEKAATLTPGPS
jgi:hypothetical protein